MILKPPLNAEQTDLSVVFDLVLTLESKAINSVSLL